MSEATGPPAATTIDLTDGLRRFRLTTRLDKELVDHLVSRVRIPDPERSVLVLSHPPLDPEGKDLYLQARINHPGYGAYVGRFPVPDPLPGNWVPALERVDEIWVPTRRGREILYKAGIPVDKVVVVPPVVALEGLRPIEPYPLEDREGFRVLAFVDDKGRTGWEEVVAGWLGAFEPGEDVTLVLAPRPGAGRVPLGERVAARIRELGRDSSDIPDILLVEEALGPQELCSLCMAVESVVVPRDEDERGLVALYAMACGIAPMGFGQGVLRSLLHSSRAFPLGRDDSMELALKKLRDLPMERKRRGRGAADYVARNHLPAVAGAVAAARIRALKQACLADPGPGGPVLEIPPGEGEAASTAALEKVGEIRVATRGDYRALLEAGIPPERLVFLPKPLPDSWLREKAEPLPAFSMDGDFRFLFAPDSLEGSGWENLVQVFARLFQGKKEVVLHVVAPAEEDVPLLEGALPELLARGGGARSPAVVRVHGPVPGDRVGGMLAAVHCALFPASSPRVTGAERRAFAAGVPLVVPGWGDHLDLCGEPGTARLLTMRPAQGGGWEPDPADLARALSEAVQGKAGFPGMGDRAREEAARNLSRWVLGRKLVRFRRTASRGAERPRVVFEGPLFRDGSQAFIMAELARTMARAREGDVRVLATGPADQPPGKEGARAELLPLLVFDEIPGVEALVRGGWPPVFRRPLARRFIARMDWEWGRIPLAWLAPLETVDRIWVHSEHVRRTFLESGVSPGKVRVVHHGVDPDLFTPQGPVLEELKERIGDRHAFLFVGGALFRKGLDVLLGAYLRAFKASDPVCLVVKEVGGRDFYEGQGMGRLVDKVASTAGAPAVLRVPEKLDPAQMAALYRTCDTLVHPYRGEGFALPVLEAMASGLPVIVTGGGATDDFAKGDSVLTVPAAKREVELPIPCAGVPWILEPDQAELAERMAEALEEKGPLRTAGKAASMMIRSAWTWERSARKAWELLDEEVNLESLSCRYTH